MIREVVKQIAQSKVTYALKTGRLIRPDRCEDCGKRQNKQTFHSGIEAHHDDYSKPLEVRWLCLSCHHKIHDWESKKTHCPQGHPYSDDNLVIHIHKDGHTYRQCKECNRVRNRLQWQKHHCNPRFDSDKFRELCK